MRQLLHIAFVTVALLGAGGVSAQKKIDSLRALLNQPGQDKALLYTQISTQYVGSKADSVLYYANLAKAALKPGAAKRVQIEVQHGYATALSVSGKTKEAIAEYLKLLSACEELGDSVWLGKALHNVGRGYLDIGSYEPALKYLEQSRAIKEALKDSVSLASTYTSIGLVHNERGWFEEAQQAHMKALLIFEKKKDLKGKARSYNNLGSVYLNQSDLDEALKFYRLSLNLKKEIKSDKRDLSSSNANMGVVFYNMRNHDSALYYYNISLQQKEEVGDKKGIGIGLNNMGLIYRDKKEFLKAKDYLRRALEIRRAINDQRGIASSLNALGGIYVQEKKYGEAMPMLLEAARIGREINSLSVLEEGYLSLSKTYAGLKNFEKAYMYDTILRGVHDSMYSQEKARKISELQTKYNSEVQTRTIQELEQKQRETELLRVADDARGRTRTFLIGGVALVLVLVLVFVILRYLENQRSKGRLQAAYDEIESKNKDITDSIRYAQRIQRSVLPEPAEVKALFPESFILYKPKDIVSGDFYWVAKSGIEGLHIIAVADCTGHGVPGAFMSLVGTDYLNQAARSPQVNDCTSALHFIDEGLKHHLKQTGDTDNRDGMDIALCAWSPKENVLQYAGAFRPLFVVQDGQMKEYEASRCSLGGAYTDKKEFYNHVVKLKPGDIFYLFTDGFSDQFGGKDGKKFKTKQLKELLLSISHKPMHEQQEILERTFEAWRGSLEQVDDVCVVGVRIDEAKINLEK